MIVVEIKGLVNDNWVLLHSVLYTEHEFEQDFGIGSQGKVSFHSYLESIKDEIMSSHNLVHLSLKGNSHVILQPTAFAAISVEGKNLG